MNLLSPFFLWIIVRYRGSLRRARALTRVHTRPTLRFASCGSHAARRPGQLGTMTHTDTEVI